MSEKAKRQEYPRCPRCGHTVAAAMMTSGTVWIAGAWHYRPEALSAFCTSAECNYDIPLSALKTPPPLDDEVQP